MKIFVVLGLALFSSIAFAAPPDPTITPAEAKAILLERAKEKTNAQPEVLKHLVNCCGIDLVKQTVVPNDRDKATYDKMMTAVAAPDGGEYANEWTGFKNACGSPIPTFTIDYAVAVDAEGKTVPPREVMGGFWLACLDSGHGAQLKPLVAKIKTVHVRLWKDMTKHNSKGKYDDDHNDYQLNKATGELTMYTKHEGMVVGQGSQDLKKYLGTVIGVKVGDTVDD